MTSRIFTVIDDQPVYLPGELSRKILLMLDGDSLHQARQVCQGWNQAVLNLVWGEDRVAVERKLEDNWRFAQPLRIERNLHLLDGFKEWLVSLSGNRALMMFQDDEYEEVLKFVEFNIKEGKVISSVVVPFCPLPNNPCLAREVRNSVVVVGSEVEDEDSFLVQRSDRVLACNLQTEQITYDEVYKHENYGNVRLSPKINETSKEIYIGILGLILKITEDNVIEETADVENYPKDIVTFKSNLCITQSPDGMKLWRCEGNKYQEINVLDPVPGRNFLYEIYPDTSRIVSVSSGRNISEIYSGTSRLVSFSSGRNILYSNRLSVKLWNSETGNLIQEETLRTGSLLGCLKKFKIEGNHLVLLGFKGWKRLAGEDTRDFHILIYELDQLLAGESTVPREFALGDIDLFDSFGKLLVDKTSVTVASDKGAIVKLDFWRCE